MSWNVITAFVLDQVLGYQGMNRVRDNLIALVSRRSGRFLGGSKLLPVQPCWDDFGVPYSKPAGLGPHDADGYIDVEIDGTNQGGITYQARVEVRGNTGFSITPKVRNITDSSDAGTGVSCTAGNPDYSGTNQRQTIALTIPTGVKKYRLMYTLGAIGQNDWWCSAELESFATA